MECNRDEALRAKSIAEGKIEKEEFAGAKKFALKAQALYLGLNGISQMLATLDVYVAAENKINGEVDWYAVLSVNPSADDEALRKQYRKLALMLHPDKNKSIGADGAFKLISEAWTLLSDKAKRLAYNQRRSSKGFQQKVSRPTAGSSAPPRTNGVYNFTSRTSVPKSQNDSAKVPPTSIPTSSKRTDTFWSICHRCKMHYEYLKLYLNSTILCPNCKHAFMASETTPPFNFSKSSNQVPRQRQQASSGHAPNRNAFDSGRNVNVPTAKKSGSGPAGTSSVRSSRYQQVPHSGKASVRSTDSSIAAKAANVVLQSRDKLKKAHTKSQASASSKELKKKKIIRKIAVDMQKGNKKKKNMIG